jgi:sec-independent protein translocase protein TatA
MTAFASIFGGPDLLILFVVVLLLFGGAKIPELMRGLGKGVSELRKGVEEGKQFFEQAMTETAHESPKLEVKSAAEALPRASSPDAPDHEAGA